MGVLQRLYVGVHGGYRIQLDGYRVDIDHLEHGGRRSDVVYNGEQPILLLAPSESHDRILNGNRSDSGA
jgi:hypothetical protein